MVYMDMSIAFDKICHHRLLSKLRKFGFGGSLLQQFQTHLTDRRQRVTVSGATSEPLHVCSGVPQGSILGPALFFLYINDLSDVVEESNIAMFADDTNIYKEVKSAADAVSSHASAKLSVVGVFPCLPFFNMHKCLPPY